MRLNGSNERRRGFAILVGLQVAITGVVYTAYAYETARGPSDEVGGLLLTGIGLMGAWYFWRKPA